MLAAEGILAPVHSSITAVSVQQRKCCFWVNHLALTYSLVPGSCLPCAGTMLEQCSCFTACLAENPLGTPIPHLGVQAVSITCSREHHSPVLQLVPNKLIVGNQKPERTEMTVAVGLLILTINLFSKAGRSFL